MANDSGFIDLGKKPEKYEGDSVATSPGSPADKTYYPDFYFSAPSSLPEMEIGPIEFTVKGRVTGISENASADKDGKAKETCRYTIEVHGIKLNSFVKDNDREGDESDGGERLDKEMEKIATKKSK